MELTILVLGVAVLAVAAIVIYNRLVRLVLQVLARGLDQVGDQGRSGASAARRSARRRWRSRCAAAAFGFAPAAMLQSTQSDEERQAPRVQF